MEIAHWNWNAIVIKGGLAQNVPFPSVMVAVMVNVSNLMSAIVIQVGLEKTAVPVYQCLGAYMDIVEIHLILVSVKKAMKVYYVINLFVIHLVSMENVLSQLQMKTIFAFAKMDGKVMPATNVSLIGVVPIKAFMPVSSQMSVYVKMARMIKCVPSIQ